MATDRVPAGAETTAAEQPPSTAQSTGSGARRASVAFEHRGAIRPSHVAQVRRHRSTPRVFSIVLAGGEGRRLLPLTVHRAKPAVPFGGVYRLIDFALSNLVNGDYRRIAVLTQYKSHSLDRHISQAWRLSSLLGDYVAPVPAQMRRGRHWFSGSADAIYQNFNLLREEDPDYIVVLGADHVYRMDPRQLVEYHAATGADVSIAATRAPRSESRAFGVIEAEGERIRRFREKPVDPPGLADDPDSIFASMGIYVFTAGPLMDVLVADAGDEASEHDVGAHVIPRLVEGGRACVYDFMDNEVPGETPRDHGYWRDVGTLDDYYSANMDLVSVHPTFNLYNMEWPVFSLGGPLPPAKFVFDEDGRRGQALDSIVSAGAIVSGGTVRRSVLSPGVHIGSGALVEDCVLLDHVVVADGAVVRRAILDKHSVVSPGVVVGEDLVADSARFTVSPDGVVVVARGQVVSEA